VRAWLRTHGTQTVSSAVKRLVGCIGAGSSDRVMQEFLACHGIAQRSLRAWARERGVAYHVVGDLVGDRAATLAREARADATLYCGGGILRAKFLDAVGGPVLNAHSGPLPHVRGMNACEWSLLLGYAPKVTIHRIDAGIDTGPVVEELALEVAPGDTVETLRGRCAELGVVGLRHALESVSAPLPARTGDAAPSRQCFALAPVLRELLDAQLGRRRE
jgi:methionyl-tRNA formyltransferase